MAIYKFNPTTATSPVDWNTPADWIPGVPNAPDADVAIPLVTYSNGTAANFNLTVSQGETYAVRSVTVANGAGETLVVNGSLSVSGALSLSGPTYYGANALTVGGTLRVGALSDPGLVAIQVSGLLASATAFVNGGSISGPGTLQFAGLTNSGTLDGVTLSVPAGTFTNLVNGTLTQGTYAATGADLTLGVGDDIVTDAATLVVGKQRILTIGRTGTIDELGQTLQVIAAGGVLNDVGSYTQAGPLLDAGTIELSAGLSRPAMFNGNGITVAAGGTIVVTGGGNVSGPIVIQAGGSVQVAFFEVPGAPRPLFSAGDLLLSGPVSGPGTLKFQPTSTSELYKQNAIELAGQTSSDVVFADQNDTLVLDSPTLFTGRIANIQSANDYVDTRYSPGQVVMHSDAIIETGVSLASVSGYSYSGSGSGGTLTVQETNGSSFALNFLGNYRTANYVLTNIQPGLSTQPSNLSITYNAQPNAKQDFNGDGTSDLVLQNDNGPVVLLTTQNLVATGSYSLGNPGGSWHAVGVADFDGNGTPDVLFQNDNGAIVDYITAGYNGTQVAGGFLLDNPGSSWHVRGTGDFNGDGKADIVLQNDSGLILVEYTNGGAVIGSDVISNPGRDWTVEAVGDLNADGQPDLLLQNSNGSLVDFLMTGAKPVAGLLLAGPSTHYSVAGIGDYNGDKFGDIVLHNDDGTDVILYTRGAIVSGSSAPVGNPGATWTGVTPGLDLNGDGTSDLVLGNQNGAFVGVDLNSGGTAPTISATLANPGPGWRSVGGTPMEFIDGTGPTLAPLSGTPGVDEFNLTSIGVTGLHVINGFNPAIDLLALSSATFANYEAVQAVEVAYQGGTFVGLPNASGVLLAGVDPSQVTAANFVLR